jgi:hypothetical protein
MMVNHTKLLLSLALSTVLVVPAFADMSKNESIPVSDSSFQCITKMTPVRGFYVASLTGKLNETVAVAKSNKGGAYPPGSVVQLVPGEVMVKQPKGTNPVTHDWEFFELDVDSKGTKIRKRGYTDVVNRFGRNCFACHVQAKPQWDLVCENNHGCQPIPLTDAMIKALQLSDPRCSPPNKLSEADKKALQDVSEVLKKISTSGVEGPK